MPIKLYMEKEKMARRTGILQMVIGIICFVVSIGMFATMDKYGVPIFALFASIFMIVTASKNISQ